MGSNTERSHETIYKTFTLFKVEDICNLWNPTTPYSASFLVSVLCFFFDRFLSKVIALLNIAIAIVVALKGDSKKITVTFR